MVRLFPVWHKRGTTCSNRDAGAVASGEGEGAQGGGAAHGAFEAAGSVGEGSSSSVSVLVACALAMGGRDGLCRRPGGGFCALESWTQLTSRAEIAEFQHPTPRGRAEIHSTTILFSFFLSFLKRLHTMPTNVSEIKEFWIPLHGLTPSRSSLQPQDDTSDVETEDDWRTFDTPNPSTSQPAPSFGKCHSQRVYHLLCRKNTNYHIRPDKA